MPKFDIKNERAKRNKSLLQRIKDGDSGALIPPSATFFPPRPIIQKDDQAIQEIYGTPAPISKTDESEVSNEK